MLCQNCKKNHATYYYEETINGKKRSMALCSVCAKKLNPEGEHPLDSLFSSAFESFDPFGGQLYSSLFGKSAPTVTADKKCPLCGAQYRDLAKSGKAGCPKCYEIFEEELAGTLRSIHGNPTHIGRTPKRLRAQSQKRAELEALKKDLQAAIAAEEFEKAASLRDRIRTLESGK
ncbi:MAG: UvrB/UvrC motif-containing protein [Clostridia bacterium]|nr:UvrB/UvrC motif-containing protein [Clostridia bacterium]